ncbi:MAG: ABC transporter ATP-binding protein [Kiloniellales bacterium]
MPANSEAYIVIDKVSKHFGSVKAVDQVSIDIKAGEFFSLLGPSGCGKTTLLRMLAGFEACTMGEIYIDRAPMSQVPPHHRPTNMVFQSYAIFPHLDVRGNVAYGLRKDRLDKPEMDRRVAEALAMVKLSGFETRKANQLSGGQRQRVALARALVKRPKVLLLDEPMGALDKKLREEMQFELRALQKSVGITFIFVTHDQEEALTMSDRIAVMSDGKVMQIAPPSLLYERPANVFVADFIGQMNFLEASVAEVSHSHAVIEAAGLGRIRAPLPNGAVEVGSAIVVAIRPEKLQLSTMPTAGAGNRVAGRLQTTAYLGDRSQYHVQVEGRDRPLAVAAPNAESAAGQSFAAGGEVWLSWADESLVLLPRS